ncbi:TauD/TfdA family dioxygenase [Pseudomonas vranovensis]|uniref:Taurine catabolism dioxygenase TauD n=1 Tax=Pseudomonas vranovensis TaxID=321661 RepID=A0A423DU39_9PSED|nr:TauD/TfdA family dioxygenase [Pseudomonas vranovensis]ROL75558.1 taurine catabolism dioxygenase TauD [Pseudomonas vranovensis]
MSDFQSHVIPVLAKGRRKSLGASAQQLVAFSPLLEGGSMPLLCRPTVPGVGLVQWASENRELIEQQLDKHAAILFRGFDVQDIETFNRCVDVISGGALEYLFRASPRTQITRKLNVYSSTDYPAVEKIFPHNEHSYSPVFPLHLYFYCDLASQTGGETPLGDTRLILDRIDPQVREAFARKGVLYVRNYGDGMGLPWQTVFQTEDREAVEAYCRKIGVEPQWKPGNRLRTRQRGPAMVRHPRTGETVWFNHATFFNALTLPDSIRTSLLAEFAPMDLPQNTFFGDGSAIPEHYITHLQQIYREVMVEFPWQQGDVVILDNILTVHARNEYTGPRKILTAMAIALNSVDVAIG